jgi:hypothetical protein
MFVGANGENVRQAKPVAVPLSDVKIHVKTKLSALWTTVVLCYIYGDLFGFFRQSTLTDIVAGKAGFIGTQNGLLGAAVSVAIPSVMVFLSFALAPPVSRWANIILGAAYTIIIIATMPGAWFFYVFLGVVEVILTTLIVWYAWTWPRPTDA